MHAIANSGHVDAYIAIRIATYIATYTATYIVTCIATHIGVVTLDGPTRQF